MDGVVTVATKRNGFPHLVACVSFLEPLVSVTSSRNQMMVCGAFPHDSPTEATLIRL